LAHAVADLVQALGGIESVIARPDDEPTIRLEPGSRVQLPVGAELG
jgi:hypothetical protein